ncbi:hypothetical protein BH10PSE5_BH10PSE5_23200 [soil metagenome]
MKFLCLGYYDAQTMDALPPGEIEAVMSQCGPHLEAYLGSGQVLMDAGLDKPTRRLRQMNGKLEITDAIPRDPRALIGSVSILEADDFDAAVAIAAKHPGPALPAGEQFGWVMEVRPIHTFTERP